MKKPIVLTMEIAREIRQLSTEGESVEKLAERFYCSRSCVQRVLNGETWKEGGAHPHWMSKTPTWNSWSAMIQRCTDEKHHAWERYGGRDITVCERWYTYENFLADMGERPVGLTIDRIDSNGNYELGNCRWADRKTQANNRRDNRYLEHNGERLPLAQWSERLGIELYTIVNRMKRGLSSVEVLALGDRRTTVATTCERGHLRNEANTRVTKNGHRQCRVCSREWAQTYRKKRAIDSSRTL